MFCVNVGENYEKLHFSLQFKNFTIEYYYYITLIL